MSRLLHAFRKSTFAVILMSVGPAWSCSNADKRMFVFNSDGGANSFASTTPNMSTRDVCRELDELDGTGVTVFAWCPNVGGNLFLYATERGEVMGDNIDDWDAVNPYLRDHGRKMAVNVRKVVDRGDDPIRILAARSRELGLEFWLTMRMNEIHEDDDRFDVLRSRFKEQHPELLHGKNYHPVAQYAYKKKYSYAWNYAREEVREHKLALFEEWLRYDIDGIELDFQRSPCLFLPGKAAAGMPLLTDFVEKVNAAVSLASSRLGRDLTVATRVPPSIERCRAAGIDIEAWMRRGLVDVVTPMDRGYFDPEPQLREFIAIAYPRGIKVLGGIEPNVRGYESTNRQVHAAVSNFQLHGADGIYLFNYDCHRRAGGRASNGHWKSYTDEEVAFLRSALDPAVVRAHDKQYLVSHCTYYRVAEEGGSRPLKCRFPIGEPRAFQITVGDDVEQAERDGRLQSSTLVVVLTDCQPNPSDLNLIVNGQKVETEQIGMTQKDGGVELTLDIPPIRQGANTVSLMRIKGESDAGLIESVDINLYYRP